MATADLDGDGRPERIAARRDGDSFVVTRHAVPGLGEVARVRIRADALELGVARCTSGTRGDAWLHPGLVVDRAASHWRFDLVRLGTPALTPVWTSEGSGRPNLRLDLDGDGRVDPLLSDGRILRGANLADAPWAASAASAHGARAAFGCEEAVDLDGDGDRDLVVDGTDGLRVVEVPTLRTVAHRASHGSLASVVMWGGRRLVYAYVFTEGARASGHLFEVTGGELRDVMTWPDTTRPRDDVDPAGDGTLLALQGPQSTDLLRAADAPPVHLDLTLARSADPAVARLGPVRVDRDDRPDLVGVRHTARGDAAMGGSGVSRYEVVLLGASGVGPERVVWRGELPGEGSAAAELVDLDGDGRHEILLQERTVYANCDLSTGGGGSSRWLVLDGEGATLWEDVARHSTFGDRTATDHEAAARVVDLAGDGTRGLRFRTAREEWYVLPAGAAVPAAIPPCLE